MLVPFGPAGFSSGGRGRADADCLAGDWLCHVAFMQTRYDQSLFFFNRARAGISCAYNHAKCPFSNLEP